MHSISYTFPHDLVLLQSAILHCLLFLPYLQQCAEAEIEGRRCCPPRRAFNNPPRPLASRCVEALTQHPNLQDLKQAHKGEVYPPPSPSQTVRLARSFVRLASSGPSWTLKICRENEYILFMGPSGSDTRRYNMHCKCHSTSICHSWGTFFTFRPLSPIIFMKSASKAMSS